MLAGRLTLGNVLSTPLPSPVRRLSCRPPSLTVYYVSSLTRAGARSRSRQAQDSNIHRGPSRLNGLPAAICTWSQPLLFRGNSIFTSLPLFSETYRKQPTGAYLSPLTPVLAGVTKEPVELSFELSTRVPLPLPRTAPYVVSIGPVLSVARLPVLHPATIGQTCFFGSCIADQY